MADTIAPTQPVIPGTASQVAVPREPSAAEMAVEFKIDPSLLSDDPVAPSGAANNIASTVEPEKKAETEKKTTEQPKEEKKVETAAKEDKKVVAVDGKPIVPAVPKKEDTKPAETKKEEAKLTAGEIKPILPVSAQPKARDYTGFTIEEQNVLRAMSNEAFEYTSKLIKEQKELSKLKDSNYLQHPLAYTLSPEYTKLQEDAYYANMEGQFWREQAVRIAKGEDWFALTGWDKNGQPILSAPQKASTEAGKDADRYSLHLFNKTQEINNQLQQFSGRFKQQIDTDNAIIQQECAKRFGWCADPKMLDEKVSNPSIGERTIKQILEDFKGLFPAYHQNSVGIQVAAHLFAALQIYGQRIHELENNKAVAAVKEEEKALIETPNKEQAPAPKVETNGATSRGMWETKEFSLEGLPV